MKKIILGLMFVLSASLTFGQGFEGLYVEEIPVTQAAVDAAPAGDPLSTSMVTYRVFIDMAAGYKMESVLGTSLNPLVIETTTNWYNDPDAGDIFPLGSAFRTHPTPSESQYYDSWITIGAYGDMSRVGTSAATIVPLADDNQGPVDGFIIGATAPIEPALDPATDFSPNFGFIPGSSFSSENVIWYAAGGNTGTNASNMICIGQFTTDGYVTFELPVRMSITTSEHWVYREIIAGDQFLSANLFWTNVPNDPPTVSLVSDAAAYNAGDNALLTATAADADGINRVEFYANGALINTDNASPFEYAWPVAGTSAALTAVAFDNLGASATSNIVNITINDPNPTIVSVTSPANGAALNLNAITITADASDADQPVQSVEFFVDGSSIGSDNNGGDGWGLIWNPIIGSHTIRADATNSVGATTSSSTINVTVANALPTVAVSEPAVAGFDLVIGNDTSFVATATDVDGSVASVAFLINGVLASTDNTPGDGFSFNYTGSSVGSYTLTARATDNNGGQTTSAAYNFSVIFPVGGPAYAISNMTEFCSSSDVFCLPIITTEAVSGIIGYEFDVHYDAADVTPTGIVTVGEDLIADRDYTTYTMNVIGDSVAKIAIWFNTSAPAGTSFNGNGQVCCVEFTRNSSFGNENSTVFTAPVVLESYPSYVIETSALDGSYTTVKETLFNGSLTFWSDNSPIAYVAGVNAITNIFGDINPAVVVNPDAAGHFVFDITNGTSITIERDVDNAFDVQPVISGQDAYFAAKVTVDDASFLPNVYQIIALDVNRDGRVSAGDITQMQQRTVGNQGEYVQAGGASNDWVFVAAQTLLTDYSFRRSASYPAHDGVGFNRSNVPTVVDLIALPIEDLSTCPVISDENYKGILLGDVTGNYADQPNSVQLKSASVNGFLLSLVEKANNEYELVVSANTNNNINSYDLSFNFGENAEYVAASDLANMNEAYSTHDNNLMKISAYASKNMKSGDLISVYFKAETGMGIKDISVVTSLINEAKVGYSIEEVATPTSIADRVLSQVNIYPNPANNVLNVEVPEVGSIQIYDLNGKAVTAVQAVNANNNNVINVENLTSGVYMMKVSVNGFVKVERIVIN